MPPLRLNLRCSLCLLLLLSAAAAGAVLFDEQQVLDTATRAYAQTAHRLARPLHRLEHAALPEELTDKNYAENNVNA